MADVDGSVYPLTPVASGTFGNLVDGALYGLCSEPPGVSYFRMRGIDTTCPAIQQPAYVFWTVEDAPDWTAAQCPLAALPCGSDPLTDVADIQIAAEWPE